MIAALVEVRDLRTGRVIPTTNAHVRALGIERCVTTDEVISGLCIIQRTLIRRLDLDDPDDQRKIWRLAALASGASASLARHADLRLGTVTGADQEWLLQLDDRKIWYRWSGIDWTIERATKALALAVWGEK